KDHNVIPSSSQHPKKLKKSKNNYKKSHLFNDPTQTPTTPDQFHDPAQTPTTPSNSQNSGRGEYYDPTINPTVAPPSIPSVQDQGQIMGAQSGYDYSDSSKSFIIVKQRIPIPPNAFDPTVASSIGLDLSLFWNLKIKEIWHIIIAYLLLVLMIYRTNMNIMLITAISSYGIDGVMTYSGQIFIDTIPGAAIFGIVFIVHELSHLETGKMHGYQSRFCLLNKGVKFTLIAAIIGIPLGLPGAAVSLGLDPAENEDDMGAIKMAGPLSNLIFGFLCMIVGFILPVSSLPLIKQWVLQAAVYNFTLGLFNMIPKEFGSFALDGKFIYSWRRPYFIVLLLFLAICYAITLSVSISNEFI
ncbi:MAG: M50 family metallopeptidase, partial [Promethearchaeota archaeon]